MPNSVKVTNCLSCLGRDLELNHVDPNPCYKWWWYQGILSTEHFPKFGFVVNSRKRICLWCWCRVTLIEWHLATLNSICQSASRCPKLVRSSCKIKQSWSEFIFLYITQSSANRQTEDLMLSGRSFMKMRNRAGLGPIPGAHRIALGLDLRLGHLKQLVECTQRATSTSTYGWIP